MKDSKTLLLLVISLLLLFAAFALLWSWGYQFSFKHQENTTALPPVTLATKDTATKAVNNVSDSLQKAYYNTLDHLDRTIDSVFNNTDSMKGALDVKLAEFYRLRNQIADSFKNRTNDIDIKIASAKIDQLQQRIRQIRLSSADIESENKRLQGLIDQYKTQQLVSTTASSAPQDANTKEKIIDRKPTALVKNNNIPTKNIEYSVYALQLTALVDKDGKQQETLMAEDAQKISGTLTLKNIGSQATSADIYIVVLGPDGRVIQKSTWESGSFETNGIKKIYSVKMQAECSIGETKRLNFWLTCNQHLKGTYTMQVYHNGSMVAKITRVLL